MIVWTRPGAVHPRWAHAGDDGGLDWLFLLFPGDDSTVSTLQHENAGTKLSVFVKRAIFDGLLL